MQFADLCDDIIYVMGGSPHLGVDGDFVALQIDGDSLLKVGRHTFSGFPGFANTYIMNMDGVVMFDVSDITSPEQIGRIPGEFSFDLTTVDSIAYIAK